MKRFIIKLLVLSILILLTIDLIGRLDNNLYKKKYIDHNISRIKAFNKINNLSKLDLLFIGSSHTYAGINTKLFDSAGYNSYSIGTNTASSSFISLLWKDCIENSPPPKAIVLDINPASFSNQADDFEGAPIYRYFKRPISNIDLLFSGIIGFNEFRRIEWHSFNLGVSQFFIKPDSIIIRDSILNMDSKKGFYPSNQLLNDSIFLNDSVGHIPLNTSPFLIDKEKKYVTLINTILCNNVRVIIHEIPCGKFTQFFSKSYLKSYNQFWNYLEADKRITVIRAGQNEPEFYDTKLYKDPHHLNLNGANKYSLWLINKFDKMKCCKN